MDRDLLLNLSTISCRVCFLNSSNSNSLNDEVQYEERLELKEVLEKICSVKINVENSTPTRICHECTDKLLDAFEFIRTVKKSEDILKYLDDNVDSDVKLVLEKSKEEKPKNEEVSDVEILDFEFQSTNNEENTEISIGIDKGDESEAETSYSAFEVIEEVDEGGSLYEVEQLEPTSYIDENEVQLQVEQFKPYAIGSRLNKIKTENYHKCLDCYRSFAKEETLQKHIKIAHTVASPEVIAAAAPKPTEDHPVQCIYCPRTFVGQHTLKRHLVAVHPEESKSDVIEIDKLLKNKKKPNVGYKRGQCPHCGDTFPLASLSIHIRRHTGEKPYKCEDCGKGFPRRQDLTIHQRQHTGEKPHVCTICGKSFIRTNKLTRHMRIHTGQRPYKCDICDKAFAQSNDLKIHMRRHTGEKPYKCGTCHEGFISGTQLKNHRRTFSHFIEADDQFDPFAEWRVSTRNKKGLIENDKSP